MKMQFEHISVLTQEVVDFAPESTQAILDCTLGGGGHCSCLLENFPDAKLYGIDRDSLAVKAAAERLKAYEKQPNWVRPVFLNFLNFLPSAVNLNLIIFWLI